MRATSLVRSRCQLYGYSSPELYVYRDSYMKSLLIEEKSGTNYIGQ